MTKPATELFMERVSPEPNSGCWLWDGPAIDRHYGCTSIRGLPERAHRASYHLFSGAIPSGMNVCHACDNTWCVNPSHLWLGTQAENIRDMVNKGRHGTATQPAIFDRARRRTAVLYGYARGTKNPKNKLSVNDVLSIRTSVEKTEVLAQRYRVDRGTISRIRSRKMWCHV
ncbi:MAG: HNH endonuclease [Rhodocyclaceae bacterium]|nr:HNH endonuclease [Rhodocyclaceae bacterium]